jgi:YidC/Oxa1 family membrane protein insertase
MDKKTIPLIILCVLLAFFWPQILDQFWPTPPAPPRSALTNSLSHFSNQVASTSVPTPEVGPISGSGSIRELSIEAPVGTAKTASLENEFIKVDFTSAGAGIEKITLKKYASHDSGSIVLNDRGSLPIMLTAIGSTQLRPVYEWTTTSSEIHSRYVSPDGIEILKDYMLSADYQIQASVTIRNKSARTESSPLTVSLGMADPMDRKDPRDLIGISYRSGDKTIHTLLPALEKEVQKQGSFQRTNTLDWVALKNQYFAIVNTPSVPFASVRAEIEPLTAIAGPNSLTNQVGVVGIMKSQTLELPQNGSTNFVFSIYTGPKEYDRLSALGKHQDDVLDLGTYIGPFSKGLLWSLKFFYNIFKNWGVAIIVATVVIKIIFWPLTAVSTRNMKQMQVLGPKMKAIQEKYKDDKVKQQEETMKMYREYRINPMMGCLPILVQMPVLFAFYSVLQSSIELRGASFLWIHDLSLADTVLRIPGLDFPINPMPLLMVVTMIWQTRITPQPVNADPSMKMVMWIMPAMLLFMFYNTSSGLSLYWTVQNLLTILQTYWTKDKPVKPPQKVKARKGGLTFSRPIDPKK